MIERRVGLCLSPARPLRLTGAAVLFFAAVAARPVPAQTDSLADSTVLRQPPVTLSPITVTATRTEKRIFETPNPVTLIDEVDLRRSAPNTVSDLFVELPGLDVTGVGTNQVRPVIRGQRGQRILLLEDGMRLNNSRRQQDFGEVPALVDVTALERVEIVRGPASVLYGSDAIGGVVNLITRGPGAEGLHGGLGYRYSSHDDQHRGTGRLAGRFGPVAFQARGTIRDGQPYAAPGGTFGAIRLDDETRVHDTGVQDESLDVSFSYFPAAGQRAFVKYERYRADTAGFGYVDPADYAPEQPFIQILYPFQRYDKLTAGYRATAVQSALADRVEVTGYYQDNERRLDLNVFALFGPTAPPGAGVAVATQNFTDVETVGFRAEATKLAGSRLLLTYGLDFMRDRTVNTDASTVTVVGFGPPITQESAVPLVPDAAFRSVGAFVQGDIQLARRASLILGVRYQDVHAETRETPGLSDPLVDDADRTLVGAANAIVTLTDELAVVASVGRAFRSPNLVERFFNGPTPEGGAFQARNPDLEPETTLNVDFGVRYRHRRLSLEGFVFRNDVRNGIRIAATGDTVNGLAVFQNINVDKLRYTGVELAGDAFLPAGFQLGATYTHLASKDVLDPLNPVGETFSNRITGQVRYVDPADRFWVTYHVRHNGERKDVILGQNPVGATLPAFTVHDIRAGVTVFRRGAHRQQVGVAVTNLSDALYAEFANVSFFRPAPPRSIMVTWDMAF